MASEKINDMIAARDGEPYVAFEFYPPRTEDGLANLYKRWGTMAKQSPMYFDITWGAGGSTSDLTLDMCTKAKVEFGQVPNMHLTCTNMEAEKVDKALQGCKQVGICNIVALRGDPPAGTEKWEATEGGFTCGLDLVKYIREKHDDYFCISVAGYPEGHPNVIKPVTDASTLSQSERGRMVQLDGELFVCSDADYKAELEYLAQKVQAGADAIITQMFFDIEVFKTFVADCREYGITVPIIPGIMVIQNYGGLKRMTAFCKSRVPQSVWERLSVVKDDPAEVRKVGAAICTELCQEVLKVPGTPGLHFYTLNLSAVTFDVMKALGLYKTISDTAVDAPAPSA